MHGCRTMTRGERDIGSTAACSRSVYNWKAENCSPKGTVQCQPQTSRRIRHNTGVSGKAGPRGGPDTQNRDRIKRNVRRARQKKHVGGKARPRGGLDQHRDWIERTARQTVRRGVGKDRKEEGKEQKSERMEECGGAGGVVLCCVV
jgi:hypothetical protein